MTFDWNGDRYFHRIESLSGNTARLLLESLEGSDNDQWPSSAPLQQLSIEERPGNRQVALLVGMAGRSHWSASVTAARQDRSLLFEMACRTNDTLARLLSSYRIRGGIQPGAVRDNQLRWPGVAFSTSSAKIQFEPSEKAFEVRARKPDIEGITTVQWSYEVRLTNE